MEDHFKLVGNKMLLQRRTMTKKSFMMIKKGVSWAGSNGTIYCESWEETFYSLLGEYLCTGDNRVKNSLITWANLVGERTLGKNGTLDQSLSFIFDTRMAILELIEEEITNNIITISSLFQVMKIIDPLLKQISNTIITHYHENLLITKYELDESNEDLEITLKELADLKKALNEATIFCMTDSNDQITYANEKFCEISKYTKDEVLGEQHQILNSGYHSDAFFEEVWETIQKGNVWKGEILNKAKDGSTYWVDTTIVPFVDKNGQTYKHISIQYDITEKKKTEETLHKTEKLSMVGQLAAGIAHEIRNPLTTIKGFVQLLGESTGESKLLFTDTILEEIDRINFIVSEFMVFAKPHTYYFRECNVTEIVESAIQLLEAEAALKNVIVSFRYPSETPYITGEKNQLKQVFINIIKNAIDAMPYGGEINVEVMPASSELIISIRDTGLGMSEDQVKKLGEPFYTTKEDGNGLGLMVSFKIVQDHNGTITIESAPNRGTQFNIAFPAVI
ncbi:PAS domain-containing sensor histidine kinase [Bacillus sp. M6-12]|uniref:PAS domain-containing sensor histidine kinase n=1 Tax=Bacillus sp. M6-12 TaxID=2054166 RepID=UPI0015E10BD1|nr:PAS domain-containing sensor histidine kinase [Bacillus sp. M6-12]